jgi:hypothetical protein
MHGVGVQPVLALALLAHLEAVADAQPLQALDCMPAICICQQVLLQVAPRQNLQQQEQRSGAVQYACNCCNLSKPQLTATLKHSRIPTVPLQCN